MTKQILFLSAILLTIFIAITACSTDSEPDLPAYTLTIEITPEGAGTTNPLPGGFDEGANLELEAIPAENYLFDRWEGDLTTESNPADLTMNSDKVITAVFKRAPLTIGGDGSQANPYQVHTLDDLVAIGLEVNLDKHYIQVADIDASASEELQNGSGFQPIGTREQPFTGSYNGDGHTISSLFIHNQKTGDDAVGFFGYVKDGLFENITIDNRSPSWLNKVQKSAIENETIMIVDEPPINQVDLSETRGVGGFIGFNDGGIVRNCSYLGVAGGFISQGMAGFIGVNTGTVENAHFDGNLTSGSVAGFVWINAGEIRQSSAKGSGDGITGWGFVSTNYGQIINSYVNMDVNGTNGAAGFVGNHEDGIIQSSFASGVTSSSINISGFVLTNNAEISNVYSTMNLEVVDFDAPRQVSGIVISNEENGTIENTYFAGSVEITGSSDFSKAAIIENLGTLGSLYWDMERSDLNDAVLDSSPDGATGLSTAQMTGPAAKQNMPEFDWVNIWRTTEDGYPVLRWEEE